MKKIKSILLIFLVIVGLTFAGCEVSENSGSSSQTKSAAQLQRDNGVADVIVGASTLTESKQTEVIQQGLMTANPIPKIERSLERENLIRRLELLNDNDKIFYVYLVSYGKVMANYVAKGKVSSVNSKLTTQEQIVQKRVDYYGRDMTSRNSGMTSYNSGLFVVESPDLDGSYGTNGDGIFFFTTEGAYVEWAGEYMVSDFPLKLSTPPEMIRTVE